MTTALIAGLFGLAGTGLGTFLAMHASARNEARAHTRERDVAKTAEVQAALIDYCSAVIAYLNAELNRWAGDNRARDPRDENAAAASRTARAVANTARYRLELATTDRVVLDQAVGAFQLVSTLRHVSEGVPMQRRITEINDCVTNAIARGRELIGVEPIAGG